MIGNPELNDKTFSVENYEEFYEHHTFVETDDEDARNVHTIIPRFGWAFDVIEELKPKNLLDLGTLEGSFPITIATHFGIPCDGVDLTKDGIALAKDRAERFGLKNVHFWQGTVEEQLRGFKAHSFDMVTAFELLEHVKDPQLLLKEIDRVLAPGGSVLISTPAFESPLYGKDDEKNKCHIRLYTMESEDYEAKNKYGNVRKATSIHKEIGPERIKEIGVYSHLINVRYQ
jgi:ubiquinone/menaquinone biosynthesis C-methylase UbiE